MDKQDDGEKKLYLLSPRGDVELSPALINDFTRFLVGNYGNVRECPQVERELGAIVLDKLTGLPIVSVWHVTGYPPSDQFMVEFEVIAARCGCELLPVGTPVAP